MSPEQIKGLPTHELVALYNRLTGKNIKRFSTRAKGEAQTLKAVQQHSSAVRTVRNGISGKNGRPKSRFIVQLTAESAKSRPQKTSARTALIEWLKSKDPIQHAGESLPNAATIESIEAHFNRRMRGVVQKLLEKLWLKRIEVA